MFQALKCVARGAKTIASKTCKFVSDHKTAFIGGAVTGGAILTGTAANAEPISVTFTPIEGVTMLELISPTVLAAGIATLGATALVASFAVGGGFKMAHKTYRWIMGKIG